MLTCLKISFNVGKVVDQRRSKAAKKRGLPENLKKAIETRRQDKAKESARAATETLTASKPKRTEEKGIIPAEMQKPISSTYRLSCSVGNRMVL